MIIKHAQIIVFLSDQFIIEGMTLSKETQKNRWEMQALYSNTYKNPFKHEECQKGISSLRVIFVHAW